MSNRRFEVYEYRQVLSRMRLGASDREIEATGLMGRKKVSRVRAASRTRGWLDPAGAMPTDAELAAVFARRPTGVAVSVSQCEPYREQISKWAGEGIDATTIHSALVRRHGFAGSYSSVQRFVRALGFRARAVTSPMSFEPGDAVQVDFGTGPEIVDVFTGEVIKTWVFMMTMCWSRHFYAELVTDQTVMTWLSCHTRAFCFFGGVPARVIIDNPKCAITRACYHDPVVQRAYGEHAEAFGFRIAPCPPREPQKKGRVERGVAFFKRSFVPLREIRSVADGNAQLGEWSLEVGNRVHGTTHEKPLTRFAEVERALLRPLPAVLPEPCEWAKVKVHGDCHVTFRKARYSVPYKLAHQTLWLKATPTTVQLYQEHDLVCAHPRLTHVGDRSTIDEHLPPKALAYKLRDPQWCLKRAGEIGICTRTLIERLFDASVLDNLRAAQGVIALTKAYGDARVEAACERALEFDEAQYRTVKTILSRGLDQLPLDTPEPTPLAGTYTGAGRFCRDMSTLFDTTPNNDKETP